MSIVAAQETNLRSRRPVNRPLLAGLLMLSLLLAVVWGGPYLIPYNPLKVDFGSALQAPSALHWFGTDNLGRDILARVVGAGRVDIEIAVVCVALPFLLGSLLGAVSGYFGGIVDRVLSGLIDVLWAFPFYVLVIAIVGTLGPSIGNLYLAFTLVAWISFGPAVPGSR